MDGKKLKSWARSVNSLGFNLYYLCNSDVKELQKFIEINEPTLTIAHNINPHKYFIISKNNLKEVNKMESFDELSYNPSNIVQKITSTTVISPKFYSSFSVEEKYFSFFIKHFIKNNKVSFPNFVINQSLFELSKQLNTEDFIRFYALAPKSIFVSANAKIFLDELMKRSIDELKIQNQSYLAEIFLKIKNHYSLVSPDIRANFESLFTDNVIIEKIKPYASFLSEQKPSLLNYYQNKKIFFHFKIEELSIYFTPAEHVVFHKTYSKVIDEVVNFFGYSISSHTHPAKGETLLIINPYNASEELNVEKIWKHLDIVYQQISNKNLSIPDICNNKLVAPILQEYLIEQEAVINNTKSKPAIKF